MNYVYVGKLVNTHALKGEVRIISDFELKEKAFKIDNSLFIGEAKEKEVIETYRRHKNFDMVKFKGIDYINDVVKYKGKNIYVLRSSLNLEKSEYLKEDLIGLTAYFNEKNVGKVIRIENNNGYYLLKINDKYIPLNKEFIESVDLEKELIILKNVGDLL